MWEEVTDGRGGEHGTARKMSVRISASWRLTVGAEGNRRLGDPEFVVLLIDRKNRRAALRPAAENTPNARRFSRLGNSRNTRQVVATVLRSLLSGEQVPISVPLYEEGELLVFDIPAAKGQDE